MPDRKSITYIVLASLVALNIMVATGIFSTRTTSINKGEEDNPDHTVRQEQQAVAVQSSYRDIQWEELMPKDWNPDKALSDINWDELEDNDPRAQQALDRMRDILDKAPAEKSLANAGIRISGFVAPLEYRDERIQEFLLVPYFGACIHTPPPPANQIIHVIATQPLPPEIMAMSMVSVEGTLTINHVLTDMGFSSYRMVADKVQEADYE